MPDIIVIGAGIVGAACAQALAQQGLAVLVLDAQRAGATQAGMGHLVAMDDSPAELALGLLSLQRWRALSERLMHDKPAAAYHPCGTLWVAANEAEMAAAREKMHRLQSAGVPCELLTSQQLANLEPELRPGLAGALRVSSDSIVYAPVAAQWLLTQSSRVQLEWATVTAIEGQTVRLGDGSYRQAQHIILATGVYAGELCPGLPIRSKKGHLAITDRYPGTIRHQLVELGYISNAHQSEGSSVAFNVQPRPTGQLLLGSSRQFDSDDNTVEPAMLARMLQQTLAYLPNLGALNLIRTWAGHRAATPDSLPLIGPHPSRPHLWLALGHEGLGITTATGTADLLAAQICGNKPPIDMSPYLPARFACN